MMNNYRNTELDEKIDEKSIAKLASAIIVFLKSEDVKHPIHKEFFSLENKKKLELTQLLSKIMDPLRIFFQKMEPKSLLNVIDTPEQKATLVMQISHRLKTINPSADEKTCENQAEDILVFIKKVILMSIPKTELFKFFKISENQFAQKEYSLAENTELHKAILDNDIKKAATLIESDKEGKYINAKSMHNTPLLLALKRGCLEIARKLLTHPKLDVDAQDARGLSALHLVCMLRLDSFIEILINRGASYITIDLWSQSIRTELPISPINLYVNEIDHNCLVDYLAFESFCKTNSTNSCSGFADRANLIIPGEPAYTDLLIFHIDALCLNLHFVEKDFKFHEMGKQGIFRSVELFRKNYELGIAPFCKQRNALPINSEMVGYLEGLEQSSFLKNSK